MVHSLEVTQSRKISFDLQTSNLERSEGSFLQIVIFYSESSHMIKIADHHQQLLGDLCTDDCINQVVLEVPQKI